MGLGPLTLPEILSRLALATIVLAPLNVALGFVLTRLTGVPRDFPPFSPLPLITGSVGGPLIATVGYLLLWVFISGQTVLHAVLVAAGVALLVASYSLPRPDRPVKSWTHGCHNADGKALAGASC